jgi:hypothetical protein
MVERDQFEQGVGFGVYGAISRFQALASVSGAPATDRVGPP